MNAPHIWIEGELIPPEQAKLDVFSTAYPEEKLIFEDIRCYATETGPAVFRLETHLQQFLDAIRKRGYDVDYTVDDLCGVVHRTLSFNKIWEGNIRPTAYLNGKTKGGRPQPTLAVAVWPWPQFTEQENEEWGFEDTLKLDDGVPDGMALFVVRDGQVFTPPSAQFGNSVMRRSVITLAADLGYPVFEQPISREELFDADEAFVSAAVAEIKPVVQVEGRRINDGQPGPVARALQSAFFETARGHGARSQEWLDWVWSFVGI